MSSLIYTSVLIGTLAHELMHKQTASEMHAIVVNYDGTGATSADSFDDTSHKWIYLNDGVITVTLIFIAGTALITILFSDPWDV